MLNFGPCLFLDISRLANTIFNFVTCAHVLAVIHLTLTPAANAMPDVRQVLLHNQHDPYKAYCQHRRSALNPDKAELLESY